MTFTMKERIINFCLLNLNSPYPNQIPVYLKSAKNEQWLTIFQVWWIHLQSRNGKLTVWSNTVDYQRRIFSRYGYCAFILFRWQVIFKYSGNALMGKNNHPENKYRKWFSTAITYLIAGGLCWYMLWASAISHYTVLQNTVPEWTTYFCTGITTGSLSFIYAFYIRTFNRTLKYLLNAFTGDFVLDLYWVWTVTMSVFIFFRIRLLAMNLNMMLFFRDHQEESMDIVKRDSGWKFKTLPDGYNFVQIKSSCAVTINRGWQVYG